MVSENKLNAGIERLKNPWLTLARLVWLTLVLLLLGIVLFGFPEYYKRMLSLSGWLNLLALWNPQSLEVALAGLGLTPRSLALYAVLISAARLLVYTAVGGLIFLRKSDTWLGLFASFVLIGLGATIGSGDVVLQGLAPPWKEMIAFAFGLVWPASFIFFFIFPDGRFVPRFTRLFIPLWVLFYLWYTVTDLILKLGFNTFQTVGIFFILISIASSLYSQVYRYLRVSGPVERQQTKWFLFAIVIILAMAVLQNFILVPYLASRTLPEPQILLIDLSYNLFGSSLENLILPLSIGIALFRYHLWEIDIVIRRTLVYSLLTAVLALVYFGSVVVLEGILRSLTRQVGQTQFSIVVSTLLIAGLFSPLRRRIQDFIDRRFYRRSYNAERTLAVFGAKLRDEVDLDQLSAHLVDAVHETMQPENVSLWIKESGKISSR